ncbi:uncharacterized protein I303_100989 [Kwoniella dejecticola CBS 10117]|uniref:Uncharacterized protein n=1 Tax=Kwoniella dejecticola CBS 10117 TaxID=1296121 RepID=A0A1A6AGI9_9TREE|nr:uncharacterized protein I303_00994 [Kwoniella dejecticola CBS 10117]OBR89171.1 hypothetical protein I303_00994 [Kwoniella dejecticola CBS 10117]
MSDVQGVKFELFSLPRSFTNPERYGFLDDLIFEYTHRRVRSRKSHKYLLIGLGTARLINHRCRDHAISWEFATNALRFKKYAKEIGIMTTEVVVHKHDEKKLVFGKELFAYYGDEYARLACAFISVDSPDLPEFRLPQIENPAWSSDSRRESRENSMDLGNYQMEGASAKQPQEYLNTDSDYEADEQKCLKWARTKSSRGRKRNLAQSPDHESQLEVDVGSDHDDHVDYLKTRHSAGNRVDISKRQKRIVSPEVQDIYTLEHDTVFPSMLPSTFTHIQEDGITIQGPDTQPGISIPTTSNTELIDRMIEMQEKMGNYLRNVKDREEQCTRILSDLLDMREHLREDKQQLYQLQEEHMRLINDMKTTDKARDKAHRETTTLAVEDTDRSETGEDDGLDDSLEDTTLRDQASAYTGHLMCSQHGSVIVENKENQINVHMRCSGSFYRESAISDMLILIFRWWSVRYVKIVFSVGEEMRSFKDIWLKWT